MTRDISAIGLDAARRFREAIAAQACGRALPAVALDWENSDKDTTSESTPGQRSCNSYRGPRRPKGHDRLMETVSARPDGALPTCPNCGKPASAGSVRSDEAIRIGDYRCARGHIWVTRWLVSA